MSFTDDYDVIEAKTELRRHVKRYADGMEDFTDDRPAELTAILTQLETTFPGDASADITRLRALADLTFYFAGEPIGDDAHARLLVYLQEL